MPALFDKLGIRFQYPENWTVETDDASPGRQTISVYSPGGAFWTVTIRPLEEDSEALAQTALAALELEYDELDSEKVRETLSGIELRGYDVNFYCLDLTNTAQIRVAQTDSTNYLVICQAEDREFARVAAVFQAMTITLLSK